MEATPRQPLIGRKGTVTDPDLLSRAQVDTSDLTQRMTVGGGDGPVASTCADIQDLRRTYIQIELLQTTLRHERVHVIQYLHALLFTGGVSLVAMCLGEIGIYCSSLGLSEVSILH